VQDTVHLNAIVRNSKTVDFFVFVSEQWLLVSTLLLLVYVYMWREKAKGGRGVSAHEATRMLNRDEAILVDLRDEAEYKAGHIVDALNIPHAKLADRSSELSRHKSKTLILVDKMGQHVGNAGRTLKEQEFEVCRLEGGMSEWQSQNLPVVQK